jgi:hypothetical protein
MSCVVSPFFEVDYFAVKKIACESSTGPMTGDMPFILLDLKILVIRGDDDDHRVQVRVRLT